MGSYTQIIYQIVIATQSRRKILSKPNRTQLYKYISGIIKNKSCILFAINGTENHFHLVISLHPSVALADLVREIKTSSNKFIKEQSLFPEFQSWGVGYGAFTYSVEALSNLIRYVENQEEHHRKTAFKTEFVDLLEAHRISYKEDYLFL
ncbi:MAG: IS200/IS605 family transposase [Bacteroidia bacterium]|nr:IS200/IS605 family transposase [Bacteroidia bacterium]